MFCSVCGSQSAERFVCNNCGKEEELNDLITFYFHRGYLYAAIVGLLNKRGFPMCLRTLKRRLASLDLKRNGNQKRIDEGRIRQVIQQEIEGPGSLAGYRNIWHALRLRHNIHIPRDMVARIIREMDPDGVNQRKSRRLRRRTFTSKGANASWHIDGYDKMKPYGFPIHGAVDGFSRRILWLEVVRSNNDPRIPGKLFLDYVSEVGGCPLLLVSDCGTENVISSAIQCTFRTHGEDEQAGEKAHKYCSSPSNQRIEGWWSFLRRHRSNWWISLFKDMVDYGLLQLGNTLHMECLWFCFSRVLQNDLDNVKDHWNSHKISKSPYSTVHGVPDIMYFLPEYHQSQECLVLVSAAQVMEMEEQCYIEEEEENMYQEYFEYVLETEGWVYPSTADEAGDLYQKIIQLQEQ